MRVAGVRDLKNNLSRYVRRVEAGERIAVTAHGRVVAELGPVSTTARRHYDELVAGGVVRLAAEPGDPTDGWPEIRLVAGTAAALIDADRDER